MSFIPKSAEQIREENAKREAWNKENENNGEFNQKVDRLMNLPKGACYFGTYYPPCHCHFCSQPPWLQVRGSNR